MVPGHAVGVEAAHPDNRAQGALAAQGALEESVGKHPAEPTETVRAAFEALGVGHLVAKRAQQLGRVRDRDLDDLVDGRRRGGMAARGARVE